MSLFARFEPPELAICVHEGEAGHPAGSHEFFVWADDLGDIQADLVDARALVHVAGYDELRSVDPHRQPGSGPPS